MSAHSVRVGFPFEFREIDRNRKSADDSFPSVMPDKADITRLPGDGDRRYKRPQAGDKVAQIARCLEADDCVRQQAFQHLAAPRKLFKNIRRRKRNVKKKNQLRTGRFLPEQRRYLHQLVIVNPDERVAFCGLRGALGETGVHPQVKLLVAWVEVAARLKIVKQRPHDLVGKTFVIFGVLFRAQRDRFVAIPVFA